MKRATDLGIGAGALLSLVGAFKGSIGTVIAGVVFAVLMHVVNAAEPKP